MVGHCFALLYAFFASFAVQKNYLHLTIRSKDALQIKFKPAIELVPVLIRKSSSYQVMPAQLTSVLNITTLFVKIFRRQLALTLLFLSIAAIGFSQNNYLRHFTVDDGLPSNECYHVVQDSAGYLIIATDRGAVRYDGYSFENLLTEKKEAGNPIYYLYKSPSQKLYLSSHEGRIYVQQGRTMKEYPHNKKTTSLYTHAGLLIANTLSEASGSLWISFNNDYNHDYNSGSCVISPGGDVKKINSEDGVYFDLGSRFYYRQISNAKFLDIYQPLIIKWQDNQVTRDTVKISWSSGYVRRLYYEQLNGVDVFCIGRRLMLYSQKKKIGEYSFDKDILELKLIDGKIFLGLANGGCTVYSLENNALTPSGEKYLAKLSVSSIYKDNRGGLWFSTHENGIFYKHPNGIKVLEDESKIAFIEKRDSTVYIGYQSGKIQSFSRGVKTGEFRLKLGEGEILGHISFELDGRPIPITNHGYYMQKGKAWTFYESSDVFLYPIHKNLIYGADAGFARLNIYTAFGTKPSKRVGLPKKIVSMHHDGHRLWLGTIGGVYLYENDSLTSLSKLHPIFGERVISIRSYMGKWILVSTLNNGFVLVGPNKELIFSVDKGLPVHVINTLDVDGNTIWLGFNKGISELKATNKNFITRSFGGDAGLPTIDIHELAVLDGWIYYRWVNKLVVVPDRSTKKEAATENVFIHSIILNDKEIEPGNGQHTFPPDCRSIDFHFKVINPAGASQQDYVYTLDGFDKHWKATRQRNIKYTNLPPGTYTFSVFAPGTEKEEARLISTYRFRIQAAIWEKWWFPVLVAGIVFLLGWAIFKRRIKELKQQNQLKLQLAENQQKALVQLINPHFIFNTLNIVQASILKSDKLNAASLVSKFAKLMRQTMELSKEKMICLEHETELLRQYFELELLRSPDKFRYEINPGDLNSLQTYVPSMLIQPFVENAINHGVMHLSDRKGVIRISFRMEEDTLYCTVDDNGVGRNESALINANKRANHKSAGIDITIARLKLLHQELKSRYFYRVTDKTDSNGGFEGTLVEFTIPYKINSTNDPHHNS